MTNSNAPRFLVSAFALEVFSTQTLFIYTPLQFIFNGGESITASFLRATAYIGPVIFGYCVGILVDHFNKRNLGCTIATVLSAVAAGYSVRLPDQTLSETFFFLAVVSVGTYALNNLRASVMPSITSPAQLSKINSTLLVAENTALIAAPLVASLLLSSNNPRSGFMGIAVCFCISSVLYHFALYAAPSQPPSQASESFLRNLRILIDNKPLLHLVYVVMGNNAFTGVYLLYVLVNAAEAGLFMTQDVPHILIAFALGSILSGVTASKIISIFGNRSLAVLCSLFLAASGSLPLILKTHSSFFSSSFLVGFFGSYIVIAVWTLRQKLLPAAALGRVTGITSALFKLSMITAIPVAGMLTEHYSSSAAIIFGIFSVFLGTAPLILGLVAERLKSHHSARSHPD